MEIVKEPPKEGLKKFNSIIDSLQTEALGKPVPDFILKDYKEWADYMTKTFGDMPTQELWESAHDNKLLSLERHYNMKVPENVEKYFNDLNQRFKTGEKIYNDVIPKWDKTKKTITESIDLTDLPKMEKNELKYHIRSWLKDPAELDINAISAKSSNLNKYLDTIRKETVTPEKTAVKLARRMKEVGPLGKLGLVLGIALPAMELFNPDKAEAAYNTTSMLADPYGLLHSEGLNPGEDEEMIKLREFQKQNGK